MRRGRFIWRCAMLAIAISAARTHAQEFELPSQERLAQPRTMFSGSRRFVVAGLPPARASEVARWADGVADRIQRLLGAIPFERGESVLIEGRERAPDAVAVEASQVCREGRVEQALVLRGLDAIDIEQAEEALGGLLVSRYIQALQPSADRCRQPARAPDWIVVGLVHRSRGDLRRRNREAALQRWKSGEMEPLAGLLEAYVMPAGRWPQKADAMMLLEWLVDVPRGTAPLVEAFRLQASGRAPDAAWWADHLAASGGLAALERDWDLWLAVQREHARVVGPGDVQVLSRMHLLASADVEAAGGPLELAGQPLSALIPHRGEGWCRTLAIRLAIRFRLESIGQEEEALLMAEGYAEFLDQLAKGASPRRLNARWKSAEASRTALEALVAARRRYLDAVEERLVPSAREPAAAQHYLDEVESRLPARN